MHVMTWAMQWISIMKDAVDSSAQQKLGNRLYITSVRFYVGFHAQKRSFACVGALLTVVGDCWLGTVFCLRPRK